MIAGVAKKEIQNLRGKMNNVYNSVTVAPNTPTVVAGITVPARSGYSFKGVIIWSEVDCDVTVSLNVSVIGGGRISGAVQTLFLDYNASPYGIGAGDVVSVQVTQADVASHLVKATLLVEQL